jgi:hypothetical protein
MTTEYVAFIPQLSRNATKPRVLRNPVMRRFG